MPLQNEITSYCTHLVRTSGPIGMQSCIYVQSNTSRLHATRGPKPSQIMYALPATNQLTQITANQGFKIFFSRK